MHKIIILSALILAGCGATLPQQKPEPVVANHVEYLVKVPPAELLKLPDPVSKIDVDTAKQSDVARWLVDSEGRTKRLEDQLVGIGAFFYKTQAVADASASDQNKAADEAAINTQAGEASAAIAKDIKK